MTLTVCLKADGLRELDFSDDRLAIVLYSLGQDAPWEAYASDQISVLLRGYDLPIRRVRIDSTTVKSYVTVTEEGLFQLGHSKEHRPDLPQLKINQSVLDPLGIPLTTTIVSGECADDPLYVPEIRKAQACIQQHGVLYVGEKQNGGTQHPLLRCGASRLLPVSVTGSTDAEGGVASLA
jgi:transposase